MADNKTIALATTRIALGLIFLWAFVDKLFGLGFSTCRDKTTHVVTYACEKAWISGGSPTTGYLGNLAGTFSSILKPLAGQGWVDVLFMIGLLGIGLALVLGVALHLAAWSGTVLMALMWLASLPIATNPLIDDHLIYAFVLWVLYLSAAGEHWGLAKWGKQTSPWLK